MTKTQLQYTIEYFEDGTACFNGTRAKSCENTHTLPISRNDNEISEPIELGLLPQNITMLLIPNCNLMHLPNELEFSNLIEVDLSFNFFKEVPNFIICKNKNLRKINLSHNKLRDFNSEPRCCQKLRYLNLYSNSIYVVPHWIFNSSCTLETLDIGNNPLETIESCLSGYSLIKLRSLEMNNSNLKRYSPFIHEIPSLVKLSLSNINKKENLNTIQELPFKQFNSSGTLSELHFSRLGCSHLSEDISELRALEILNVSYNHLSWLPKSITNLKSLKFLNLTQNELLCLPSDIGELKNLEELHLSYNLIGSLPESILNLQKLKILDLYSNDLIETVLTVTNQISTLIAFDIEQNSFTMNEEENYLQLREKMWKMKEPRIRGSKLIDISDDECKRYSSADENYESDLDEDGKLDISSHEEENWDFDNIDSLYDDSMLVLPPYKFQLIKKASRYNPSDHINPIYFEDAPEDDT